MWKMDSKKRRNFWDDHFFVIFEIMGCLLIYKQIMGWLIKQWRKFQENCFVGFWDVENSLSGSVGSVIKYICAPIIFVNADLKIFFSLLCSYLPIKISPTQKIVMATLGIIFFFFQFQISALIKAS